MNAITKVSSTSTQTASQADPPSAVHLPERAPPRTNRKTGISERPPYKENILSARILGRTRFRFAVMQYYSWLGRQIGHSARLENRGANLDRSETGVAGPRILGKNASKRVRAQFSTRALKQIDRLRRGDSVSYLLIRWLPTVGFFFPWPRDSEFPEKMLLDPSADPTKWTANKTPAIDAARHHIDGLFKHSEYVLAGLAYLLDSEIKPRFAGQSSGRNLLTQPDESQVGDYDSLDMALRFHQSTVEKVIPKAAGETSEEEGCRFRLYLCVRNKWRIPIQLLPVVEIVTKYLCPDEPARRERIIQVLKEDRFIRVGPLSFNDDTRRTVTNAILRENYTRPGDWVMSFDAERVSARPDDNEAQQAIRELRQAITRAKKDAVNIVMKRGDVLAVDNWRALVSRREFYPSSLMDFLRSMLFKPRRWIRTYYAFRIH